MSSGSRGLAPRKGLECLLMKVGRTRPLVEPRRGPQAGKSGDPRSQDADSYHDDAATPWHLEDIVTMMVHCHELG